MHFKLTRTLLASIATLGVNSLLQGPVSNSDIIPGRPIEDLIPFNALWASNVSRNDPAFFDESAKGQAPQVRISLINVFCELLTKLC